MFHFGELTYRFTISSLAVSECYQFKLFTFLSNDFPLFELYSGKSFIGSERYCMMLLPVVKWNRSRQIQTSLPFLTSRSCYICYDDYTSRELLCPSPLKYRSIHSLGDNLAKNLSNNPMS